MLSSKLQGSSKSLRLNREKRYPTNKLEYRFSKSLLYELNHQNYCYELSRTIQL